MFISIIPLGYEVKLQLGTIFGFMYGTEARCYLQALDPSTRASTMTSMVYLLTGETVHPSTGRVEPVRGCLNNPSRLVWTTLTSLTAPLAALRSRKETKEKVI
jgi:hypothetical protein